MEKIGITDKDDVLVKMTREEFRTFKHLANAIERNAANSWELDFINQNIQLPEFSGVFGTIEAFALAQYRVNDLQDVLDKFKAQLNKGVK